MLGDMGAEVIKIERQGGEDGRKHRPMWNGHSLYAMTYNRNKHGLTVNTRNPEGIKLIRDLAREADIVVENYRPGTMEAMGLSYEELKAVNPKIILTSVSGFGQTGPNRHRVLFDAIAQAETGLMSVTGKDGDDPTLTGTFIADYTAGFHAVIGTLLALQARTLTGEGQHVDVALFDALFTTLSTHLADYSMHGQLRTRTGSRDQITVPANTYQARDGWLYLHAGTNAMFPRLAQVMGRPELAEDPRYCDQNERLKNVEELDPMVSAWVGDHTVSEMGKILEEAGIPWGRVATVAESVDSEQVQARDMMPAMEHPVYGNVKLPGIPIKMSGTPGSIRKPPPIAGEDTEDILTRLLGLDEQEIERLRSIGAV